MLYLVWHDHKHFNNGAPSKLETKAAIIQLQTLLSQINIKHVNITKQTTLHFVINMTLWHVSTVTAADPNLCG